MFNSIHEERLKLILDRLSNNEPVEVEDDWINDAGEAFKDALIRQFTPRDTEFRLRMSNIGKPLCQLKHEKAGTKAGRRPYNHIVRMMIGDATESIMSVLIKAAELPVTAEKTKCEWTVGNTKIKGEDDLHIDHKVYDTKSCSPWAFDNKWSKGWKGLMEEDGFGYKAQIIGYSLAQNKEAGGWIVVNKSTGEIKVVAVDASEEECTEVLKGIINTVAAIENDEPFERCFEAFEETFRKKPTGNTRLPTMCTMCDFLKTCWPDAQYKPQAMSQAKDPSYYWYDKYVEQENDNG